jgi:hypothetical protein
MKYKQIEFALALFLSCSFRTTAWWGDSPSLKLS